MHVKSMHSISNTFKLNFIKLNQNVLELIFAKSNKLLIIFSSNLLLFKAGFTNSSLKISNCFSSNQYPNISNILIEQFKGVLNKNFLTKNKIKGHFLFDNIYYLNSCETEASIFILNFDISYIFYIFTYSVISSTRINRIF